ncbi:MAG: endonuclease/exonuclease/phosphatase family protein [Thermoguttaceae bacterium]
MIRPGVLDTAHTVGMRRRYWPATTVAVCTWLYLGIVLAVWLLLRLAGDRWWFATVILFGPRWLCAVPLAVLVPAAVLLRRRMLFVLAAAAILVFGPIMGFCLPWGRLAAAEGPSLRVLTCNLKGECHKNAALDRIIEEQMPDVVALQGCYGEVRIRWPAGWHVCQVADFVVASRYPVVEGTDHSWQLAGHGPHMDILHCRVQVDGREIDFCSVHLLSPHGGLEAVFDRKTLLRPSDGPILDAEIEQRRLESEDAYHFACRLGPQQILAGDFNMPVDSAIYRQHWGGFRDGFSAAGLGYGYTEWPRMRVRVFGVRIDHVLTGDGWRCRRCWVGPDVGSDHLPLLADLSLIHAE